MRTTIVSVVGVVLTAISALSGCTENQQHCSAFVGSYLIESRCYRDEEIWLYISETAEACGAVVTPAHHRGEPYNISFSGSALILQPEDIGALSGETIHSMYYWGHSWDRFELDIGSDEFLGTGYAACSGSGIEEDIEVDYGSESVEATIRPDTYGTMRTTSSPILPWSTFTLDFSREVSSVEGILDFPDEIFAFGEAPDEQFPLSVDVTLIADWDTSRGETYELVPTDNLVDAAGQRFSTPLSLDIGDIGEAVTAHEFDTIEGFFSWGDVTLYEGDDAACATDGCVALNPNDDSCQSTGIAGQLVVQDGTEVVIDLGDDYLSDEPDIQVVDDNGEPLPEIQAGVEQHQWIFDAGSTERVGFSISLFNYCIHDWATGFSVDSVRVR